MAGEVGELVNIRCWRVHATDGSRTTSYTDALVKEAVQLLKSLRPTMKVITVCAQ